jgi:hypothetical protein
MWSTGERFSGRSLASMGRSSRTASLPTDSAESGQLGGHLGRRTGPPCLGTCGGGGPRLLPCALGKLPGRLFELVHSLPGHGKDRRADEQHAGEPEETADPDKHPSSCDESPVELAFP